MHLLAVAVAFLCMIASLMAFHSGTTCGRGRYLHNLHAKDGEQIKSMQGGRRNRKSRLKTEGPEFTGTLDRLGAREMKSRLPPITGTPEYLQREYEKKGFFGKLVDDIFAPTPVGQEPKSIQIAKTVTWIAVLILVATEIFVSVKVGGMPFDTSRANIVKPT